jgi:hypothetical protein
MPEAAVPAGASLTRMAQASLLTGSRSHLLPALRDVPTSLQAKKSPRSVSLKPGVNLRRRYIFVVRCSEKIPPVGTTQAGGNLRRWLASVPALAGYPGKTEQSGAK